jgi:hypothetical protein
MDSMARLNGTAGQWMKLEDRKLVEEGSSGKSPIKN